MNDNERRTSWTLGTVKARGLGLEGYCETEGCGHFYTFDVNALIEQAGPDYLVPENLPGITCDVCGGRLRFKLAMIAPDE